MKIRSLLILLLALFVVPVAAIEGIGYVTDHLRLTLFSEKGSGKKIQSLESADVLDILETSGSYLRVRTATGEEGWVKKHYIVSEPPGKIKVLQLEKEIKIREEKITSLENILDSKKIGENLKDDYEKQLVKANQENVQLFNDKEQLRKKIDQSVLEVQRLKSNLNKNTKYHPAVIPAAFAFFGVLLGTILGWWLYARKLKKRFYGFKM